MPLAALLNLAVLILLVGIPGLLLHRLLLSRVNLSWRVSIALILAAQSVLFSNLASIFGYSLPLMLAISFLSIIALLTATWFTMRQSPVGAGLRPAQNDAPVTQIPATNWPSTLSQLLIFAIFFTPSLVMFLPFDTDAQGFGYLALTVREGGTVWNLAPFHPEVRYLYSPNLFIWWAYLSDLLRLPLHQIMLPFTHLMAALTALLTIDLADALLPGRPRARWLLPTMTVFGLSLLLTVMDSHYTSVMGFLFVALFLIFLFQSLRYDARWLPVCASIALAAVALTHPDTIIILLIAYIPFYATFWLSKSQHRTRATWLRFFVIIPALGVALCIFWLIRILPLFFVPHVISPFTLSASHITQLFFFQGIVVPILAVAGLVIALRRRTLPDVLMITWVVALLDFSLFGIVTSIAKPLGINVMRYVYPFSVAWHGPILVYPYLATIAAYAVIDHFRPHPPQILKRAIPAASLILLTLAVILHRPLITLTRPYVTFFGAFSSPADLAAMTYLRENTPPDSLILNYPYGFEGHWVPVISERETVAFRDQPFFDAAEPLYQRRDDLAPIYFDLSDPTAHDALLMAGVDYLIIPQIVTDPDSFTATADLFRWRWPEDTWYSLQSPPAQHDWLELAFEQDGAQVWRVLP